MHKHVLDLSYRPCRKGGRRPWLRHHLAVVALPRTLTGIFAAPLVAMLAFSMSARPAAAMDAKAYRETLDHLAKIRLENPGQAVTETKAVLANQTDLNATQVRTFYGLMADIQLADMKNVDMALATLDEALAKVKEPADHFFVVQSKARTLMGADRYPQAEALFGVEWPRAQETGNGWILQSTYVGLLQKVDKGEVAAQLLERNAEENIEKLGDNPETVSLLVDQLVFLGREDEAAGYGRLYFMLCPFDDASIQSSMNLITKTWTAKYISPAKVKELLDAQQDPDKPSPLLSLKLPALDETVLKKRLAASLNPVGRTSIFIALGDYKAAMMEARALMIAQPQSASGVMQVCRVFKARDLNVKRANAFLAFYKSGEGVNPITAFMAEQGK